MTKTLDELINAKEPGWTVVREWLDHANKPVEVLDVPPRRGAEVLLALQVTTRSPLGAWPGWERDLAALPPDRGYSFVPPLFAQDEGQGRERRDVPMAELLGLNLELADAQ